jgi:hypothetical protein
MEPSVLASVGDRTTPPVNSSAALWLTDEILRDKTEENQVRPPTGTAFSGDTVRDSHST